MSNSLAVLKDNLRDSIAAKRHFLEQEDQLEIFGRAVDEVIARYRRRGRLYIAGNGGSAADQARHRADYCVVAAGQRTSTIQELHIVLAHTLCECVGRAIFPQ